VPGPEVHFEAEGSATAAIDGFQFSVFVEISETAERNSVGRVSHFEFGTAQQRSGVPYRDDPQGDTFRFADERG